MTAPTASPTTTEAQPQPWPHGMPVHAYLRPETVERGAGAYPSHITATTHLSLDDVLWATRTFLSAVQANHTMMWPTAPTRDEGEVALQVKCARAHDDPYVLADLLDRETPDGATLLARWPSPRMIGPTTLAAEVLTYAFTMGTLAIASSLQQLGLDAATSPDEDFISAWTLFSRPEWFDAIRGRNIPLALIHVPYILLGDEKFSLLLDLGYNYEALTKAAEHPETVDVVSLRTLLALRRPEVVASPITGLAGPGVHP